MNVINKIIKDFKNNCTLYIGEKVTIAEHMIQAAMLAERDNSPSSVICASLLHDYGHFIIDDPDKLVKKSLDGKHEDIGYKFLKQYFPKKVTEPIKLHVEAKRFLCREKKYYSKLSKASKVSLKLQGGIMNDLEAKKFSYNEFFKEALQVRKYDDDGKIPDIKLKNIEDFTSIISENLIN